MDMSDEKESAERNSISKKYEEALTALMKNLMKYIRQEKANNMIQNYKIRKL